MLETSDSNQHILVTIANLGQAPRGKARSNYGEQAEKDLLFFGGESTEIRMRGIRVAND